MTSDENLTFQLIGVRREGPGSAPKLSCHCGREIGFTSGSICVYQSATPKDQLRKEL
jgi:hypothetical protein